MIEFFYDINLVLSLERTVGVKDEEEMNLNMSTLLNTRCQLVETFFERYMNVIKMS